MGYGVFSALAVDPIEKKPLNRFHPGSRILSVGGYGCNMKCAFCQNSDISQHIPGSLRARDVGRRLMPDDLLALALNTAGSIGVAFTYSEPLIHIEYLLDIAPLLKRAGQKVALVTNGLVSADALADLSPYVDAMNIDVKSFSKGFYERHGGDLDAVKDTVRRAAAICHVEVTTLLIPGENDSAEEIDAIASWLASISPDIPFHISRFFPRYRMTDIPPTPRDDVLRAKAIASRRLKYVFAGNL
jgi:pyruvate formate lyase activating enzyme